MRLSKEELQSISNNFQSVFVCEKTILSNFWKTDLCQRMLSDLIKQNISINNKDFFNNLENSKNELSWNDINDGYINAFFDAMCHKYVGTNKDTVISKNEEISFINYKMEKEGF